MRKLFVLIFILSLLVFSCSDDSKTNDCKKDGCKEGYFCNEDKNICEQSCTQEYCDVIAQKCNFDSGLCEPWCTTNDDCDENSVCRNELCELFYVSFEDENLEACVKEQINISSDQKISIPQLENIKKLECPNRNISNLTGIEYLKNLEALSLWENNVSDLIKLSTLVKLESLQLGFNKISDITPITHLSSLKKLSLSFNNIQDVMVLKDLKSLEWLNLDNNNIENISNLINLTKLKWLTLENNPLVSYQEVFNRIKGYGARIYFELDYNKNLNKINLTQTTQDGKTLLPKKILWKVNKIISPEEYLRLTTKTSYNMLEEYALEAPNQADAGSCLFMANTGVMEILLNQYLKNKSPEHDGNTDISERYLMNASDYASESIYYTMTDLINTFNHNNGALLNKDYPFTVGWVKKDASGNRTASAEGVEGAEFTAEFNWIDQLPNNWRDLLVETPKVGRTLLFLDPELNRNSIWNVGLMNDDIIERIKYELRTKNAPVVVIYNHYLIWHTDIIIGYDDNASFDEECPMVKDTLETFREKGADSYVQKIETQMEKEGGCSNQGIFYVRDSIYDGDIDTAMYYYGGQGYDDKYSQKVIYHSYDWVKYLANHVYSVHRISE